MIIVNELDHLIKTAFNDWMNEYVIHTRLGEDRTARLKEENLKQGDQFGINAYLKTEFDFQMKFGGFLEGRLLPGTKVPDDRTVHAEMHIYDNPQDRCDLSIHSVH